MKKNFKTKHVIINGDSRVIKFDKKIDLIVTSPPYPMIKMWDKTFKFMNSKINLENPDEAFKLMHCELEKVYQNGFNMLNEGGVMIINIGDAYRKLNNKFKAYHNVAKTIEIATNIGFDYLPSIQWFKQTNAPNKFMGSGTLPVGAYVTSETESILIFRKGIRKYTKEEVETRRQSSIYYEERNAWYSNIWTNVKGTRQKITGLRRERNGSYPLEVPLRLISMYSLIGDFVWDPFGGTGTTSIATMMLGRNSYLNDIDESFVDYSKDKILNLKIVDLNKINLARINKNKNADVNFKYNSKYGPVKSKQEQNILLPLIKKRKTEDDFIILIHELD